MLFRPEFRHLADIERRRINMPEGVRLRLNRLERPEPWCSFLQGQIRHALDTNALQQYPAYTGFYERLARFVRCDVESLVVGAGIEEFIRSLFLLCAAPGEKVAILWPTCAMFDIYARAFGVELVRIVARPDEPLTAEALIAQLPRDTRLLLLANPGQPVETCFNREDLTRIAVACAERGAVFAIDEAYHGFGAPTGIDLHRHTDNVVVLRTFSKAFGAASIRLGYAVGGKRMAGTLNAIRQSGEVSAYSMAAATVLLDNYETHVAPEIMAVIRGRDLLRIDAQRQLGLRAWGRWANHVLIEAPNALDVSQRLAARGVLVKADFPAPLDSHMLVTCGGPDLMTEFLAELRAAIG